MAYSTVQTASLPPVTMVGSRPTADLWLKRLIWVYLLLLIFEGALRKWFLPFLAAPLLVVRDPIALLILFRVARHQYIKVLNFYTLPIFFISVLAFLTTFYSGHKDIVVALFGVRITLIHFPLIFVIGQVFNRADVERVGKFLLWLVVPMTVLIALQYFSPQSAWVNRGVGGDLAGAGFAGANGFYRPPATFSFTNGTTLFFSLAAVFVFYFWQEPAHKIRRLLLIAATGGIAVAIPLTISRGYMFQVVITILFFVLASLRSGKSVRRLLVALLIAPVLLLALSQFDFVQVGLQTMGQRLTNASVSEGGLEGTLGDRFLGGMTRAVSGSGDLPFWGSGLGLGTNVGSALRTGSRGFALAEGEWGRVIGEMGALVGLIFIFLRLMIAVQFTFKGWSQVFKGNALPWLLVSFGFLQMVTANWAQPTALGFSVVTCGLLLASFNRDQLIE